MIAKPIRALELYYPKIQFLIMPITHPYSQWKKSQANDKITASFQTNNVPQPLNIKLIKQKNKLWKTVRLTSFRKPQLLSVSIFFKFVHLCLPLYSLRYLNLVVIFWAAIFMFHIIWVAVDNFDKFCDTAPLTSYSKSNLSLITHGSNNAQEK